VGFLAHRIIRDLTMPVQHTAPTRIGAPERAEKARKEMKKILTDEEHPLYLTKDIDFARRYGLSRLTIYKIRKELGIPSRVVRLTKKLKKIDTKNRTINELASKLNVKYSNLYRVIREKQIKTKPDTPPIESLKKYQKKRKGKPRQK
jgi:predicted transcriptional regulator